MHRLLHYRTPTLTLRHSRYCHTPSNRLPLARLQRLLLNDSADFYRIRLPGQMRALTGEGRKPKLKPEKFFDG